PAENRLEVHQLKTSVGPGEHQLSILPGVERVVKPRQPIALIGESGSGKSTVGASVAGLAAGSRGEGAMLGKPLQGRAAEARAAV
ncbi:ATP-binding cassette domain-containing protein, partial [Klebsiella pneumoniae]|uniref:ATP-binding cassette domain-containing protein n=1 Tax=Klebsiella pneumoniae TaxID=573 RepID=UPI002730B72A